MIDSFPGRKTCERGFESTKPGVLPSPKMVSKGFPSVHLWSNETRPLAGLPVGPRLQPTPAPPPRRTRCCLLGENWSLGGGWGKSRVGVVFWFHRIVTKSLSKIVYVCQRLTEQRLLQFSEGQVKKCCGVWKSSFSKKLKDIKAIPWTSVICREVDRTTPLRATQYLV